ncbi:Guanine nucleotide-binding protein G(I)/G(S)/G(O) subunit gamma-10 [Tupaia chinensis]|uniref:Guanine nucleotide-binding protein subunit gamma n=1 Tax=Tupaia chinensis TaxID=246437 RepID=L8YA60_TUPCH|nr:Guanine nucleotide-binding protein G(I)/G(S)/G(O) subunit gamma-10 [Tupaia chinensis]
MSSRATVSALQRLVEQLKPEAGVERTEVSQAAAELPQYRLQNACKDALLLGVPAGSRPFPSGSPDPVLYSAALEVC